MAGNSGRELSRPGNMIAIDTNLLVYAYREDSPFYERAKELIEALRAQTAPWGIPWPCIHEMIAVMTNPKAFKEPTGLTDAFFYT